MTGLKWLCWLIPFCSGLMMPLSLSMAEENLSVELSSDHFVQGDTVIVRVKSIAQVEAQYVIFQEKKLPLYPSTALRAGSDERHLACFNIRSWSPELVEGSNP